MGMGDQWRRWRIGRQFKALGPGCRFAGSQVEIKGRIEAGAGCVFRNNLTLRTHKRGAIVFGDRVEVADYVLIQINDRVEIGDDTYIGPYVVLRDTNHLFQGTDLHWRLTPHLTEPIRIGKGCYLGAGCYVMPGVTLGDGAVVAPRSIVNRSIGPNEIWAGSPARMAAHRTDPTRTTTLRRQAELVRMFGVLPPEGPDAAADE